MITFDQFWQLLYDHGASQYHRYDCFELWGRLSCEQRQALYETIANKLRDRRFVDYNPLRAMHDNLRQPALPPPTNYNGSILPRGRTFYRAYYNGQRGLYTEQDVLAHKMKNVEMFMQT